MLAAAVAAGPWSLLAPAAQVAELIPIPSHMAELPLTEALATYRALDEAGGWPVITAGPSMRRGDSGERVATVRSRLSRERYLAAETVESDFGPALESAVREFQRRHGLEEDGIVGRATLAALNVPAASRAAQIELNLARLSVLPGDLGEPYVAVNIAAQHLQLVDDATIPLVSRVIVGQPSTPTPVFSSSIDRVILNPPWNVPVSIAVNEILPRLLYDPEYLLNHNMIIVDRPHDPHGLAIQSSLAG
jgi:murein L,D-transpeptidase YcbB/YkuD